MNAMKFVKFERVRIHVLTDVNKKAETRASLLFKHEFFCVLPTSLVKYQKSFSFKHLLPTSRTPSPPKKKKKRKKDYKDK